MKRRLSAVLFAFIVFAVLPLQARAAQLLIPVGKVIGLQLKDDTVTVAAYDDILGFRAREAGLKIGDELVRINEQPVTSAEDVRSQLEEGEISLTVRRGGKESTLRMTPQATSEGPRLGVYLRQGISGIGTVTFYDPQTGSFGALGHGVSSGKGQLLEMKEGFAYDARVQSVKPGRSGSPGQLSGSADGTAPFAPIYKNTPQGVFGNTSQGWQGTAVPTAAYEEIQTGSASIRSTVTDGEPQEYSVEILKIYPQTRNDGRNFLLKVTDETLLQTTGGIVQGMGVSYNRDNQEKPLACNGFWCCPYFPRVKGNSRIPCAGMPGQNHLMPVIAAEGEIFYGGNKHTYFYSIKQLSIIPATQDERYRTGSVTPFGIFFRCYHISLT